MKDPVATHARVVTKLEAIAAVTGWHGTCARGIRMLDDGLPMALNPDSFSLCQRLIWRCRAFAFAAELLLGAIFAGPFLLFRNRD